MVAYLLLQPYHTRPLLLQQPDILAFGIGGVLDACLVLEGVECICEVICVQVFED